MAIIVNDKNIGHATAYGYAKSKGYTGTEEEFAELMASYADVAEDAQQSAEDAAESASQAAGSATAAAGSASGAAQSATQAANSASAANTAKVDAQTAQSAAEGAQTAAETAQGAAEDAADRAEEAAESIDPETLVYKDDLEDYARIDGYYQNLTAGNAEQLVSTVFTEDQAPYHFRTAGGSADIGNRETDMIVGGTVAWNQEMDEETVINLDCATHRTEGAAVPLGSRVTTGHKYLYSVKISNANYLSRGITHHFFIRHNDANIGIIGISGVTSDGQHAAIVNSNYDAVSNGRYSAVEGNLFYYTAIDSNDTSGSVTISNIQLFDLTQMFGSTIADYLYNLEQSTPGAGVAWFKRYFPNDYYPYDAGTLKSVEGLESHDMVGFNAYNPTTGTAAVLGGNQYQITGAYTALSLDGETITPVNGLFTPDHNGSLTVTGGGADTCVHLTWSGYRNGEYEPYEKHSYPLDSTLTLRGIPKLDASGNLYYDGDTYESDGTVTRRFGVVDLGTLNWVKNGTSGSTNERFQADLPIKNPASNSVPFNAFCEKYEVLRWSSLDAEGFDKFICHVATWTTLAIRDTSFTDAAKFKAAMSGVMLVYELATPTTETAEPYQNPQIVDDYGTEEYVTDSIVAVGHRTEYMANLRDKLQHLPDMASSDGDYIVRQVGSQMSLAPLTEVKELPDAPTTDGSYHLTVTVSNGEPTYSWEADT